MTFMGHSISCAEALVTPVEDCACACRGAFHGGPHTHRARALHLPEDMPNRSRYAERQVADARRKAKKAVGSTALLGARATDFVATLMIDAIALAPDQTETDRVREGIALVVRQLVSTIANESLSPTDTEMLKSFVQESHLFCTLIVLILELLEAAEKLGDVPPESLATRVLDAIPTTSTLTVDLQELMRKALTNTLLALLTWASAPSNKLALQIIGVVFCPNTIHHPEVVRLCVLPLKNITLRSIVVEWTLNSYMGFTDVLNRYGQSHLRVNK